MTWGNRPRISAETRFWQKVEKGIGCWNWKANKWPSGYGVFMPSHNHPVLAHRFSYELMKGPIPSDLEIDHLCRNKGCVNPAHLEVVSSKENTLRGIGPTAKNAKKTHCLRGHPLSGLNLYSYRDRNGKLYRQCRKCKSIADMQHKARKRGIIL